MKSWLVALGLMLAAAAAHAEPQWVSKRVEMRQAMDDLALAAANHGMLLVKVQPIDQALVKRGFDNPHVRLVFIGSEVAVRWAEAADSRLLNLLPLRFALIQQGDHIIVMADDLEPWKPYFKDSPGQKVLQAWEVELREVLADFMAQ
jgi:uncharacterized membrane protein (UPF0127 family)